MLGDCGEPIVELRNLASVNGVGGLRTVGERAERKRKAHVICCDALVTFLEALKEVAKLYVNFGGLAETTADRVESLFEVSWKAFFKIWRKDLAVEFFLDRNCRLFTPDSKFLGP